MFRSRLGSFLCRRCSASHSVDPKNIVTNVREQWNSGLPSIKWCTSRAEESCSAVDLLGALCTTFFALSVVFELFVHRFAITSWRDSEFGSGFEAYFAALVFERTVLLHTDGSLIDRAAAHRRGKVATP